MSRVYLAIAMLGTRTHHRNRDMIARLLGVVSQSSRSRPRSHAMRRSCSRSSGVVFVSSHVCNAGMCVADI